MGHPVLLNWSRLLLIKLNNSLVGCLHTNLLTYLPCTSHLPSYILTCQPTCLHTYLPSPHLLSYILTYLPTYLLLLAYHPTSLCTHVTFKRCSPMVRAWVINGEVKGSIPNTCNLYTCLKG